MHGLHGGQEPPIEYRGKDDPRRIAGRDRPIDPLHHHLEGLYADDVPAGAGRGNYRPKVVATSSADADNIDVLPLQA